MKKLFYLLVLIVLISCTKEETNLFNGNYDTIFPEPYLPVYPGSFWSYNGGTILYRTSDSYVLNSFEYTKELVTYESKPFYVSFWRGFPIYKYSSPIGWKYENIQSDFYKNDPKIMLNFLSTEKNAKWVDSSVLNHNYDWTVLDSVKTIDTSIQIGNKIFDHVIVIEHKSGSYNSQSKKGNYYYAKDVGLIRKDNERDSAIMLLDTFYNNH